MSASVRRSRPELVTAISPPAVLVPPHDAEAEASVLGAILLSGRALYGLAIEDGLRAEDFYAERNRLIYAAMLELHLAGEPVDMVTVTAQLRAGGQLERVGGRVAVEALGIAVPQAGAVRRYAAIVRDQALRRELLTLTHELQADLASGLDGRELLEGLQRDALELSADEHALSEIRLDSALAAELERLQAISRRDGDLTGLATGLADLDELTGGLQDGNLVIIAARPSMGKSALVTNMATHVALIQRRPVLFYSLEMGRGEISQRVLAAHTPYRAEKLLRARIAQSDWPALLRAAAQMAGVPLYINDRSAISLTEIRGRARHLHHHHQDIGGVGLIVVDYLQLLRPEGRADTRTEEVGAFSRGLKALARELRVPVIAISQLNREVERRNDKKPTLADLRDSGELEQDADLIAFLYREDYYDPDSDRQGEADLLIRKHRNGPSGVDIPLSFDGTFQRFAALAHSR